MLQNSIDQKSLDYGNLMPAHASNSGLTVRRVLACEYLAERGAPIQ